MSRVQNELDRIRGDRLADNRLAQLEALSDFLTRTVRMGLDLRKAIDREGEAVDDFAEHLGTGIENTFREIFGRQLFDRSAVDATRGRFG